MAININILIEKRHLIIFSCIIAIFGIVLMTNAYGGNQPDVMGHSAGELDVSIGGDNKKLQNFFDEILDDSGNIDYANSAGDVNWDDVNSKPDVATESWVSNNYATEEYVDDNAGFSVSEEYRAYIPQGGGTRETVNMGSHEVCFLTMVRLDSQKEMNRKKYCRVYESSGSWYLELYNLKKPAGDCRARCIN